MLILQFGIGTESIELFKLCFKNKGRFRSSRPEVFCKKGVLRNFVKFTGKDLQPRETTGDAYNFIKKRL